MTLRAAVLLALAAFGVHEARYLIVPDPHADAGHAYLAAVPVVLALALALALGRTLAGLGRGHATGRALSWLACSAALMAIHGGQELAEHLLAAGGRSIPACCSWCRWRWPSASPSRWCCTAPSACSMRPRRRPPLPRPRLGSLAALIGRRSRRGATVAGIARHLGGRAPPAFG